MFRILVAGIPDQAVYWIEQNLDTVEVEPTFSANDTLERLENEDWSLVILDDSFIEISPIDVVHWIRNELELNDLPIICCLNQNADQSTTSHLSQLIGKDRIIFHPLDATDLCRKIEGILNGSSHGRNEDATSLDAGTESPFNSVDVNRRRQLVREALADIWEEFQHANIRHISAVQEMARRLGSKAIDEPVMLHTQRESQELAKSLMSFGLLEDAALAHEIELILGNSAWPDQGKAERLSELASALKTAILECYPEDNSDALSDSSSQLERRYLV